MEHPEWNVPKGRNFHNRRSTTCGTRTRRNSFLKGRTSETTVSHRYAPRRSPACGYESPDFWAESLDV
ncbi:MAG: hypothetical protein LBF67_07675 [Prevotellaceae bacterium]|nr:hypothetical protein [Prevotellaceae bacterium]